MKKRKKRRRKSRSSLLEGTELFFQLIDVILTVAKNGVDVRLERWIELWISVSDCALTKIHLEKIDLLPQRIDLQLIGLHDMLEREICPRTSLLVDEDEKSIETRTEVALSRQFLERNVEMQRLRCSLFASLARAVRWHLTLH